VPSGKLREGAAMLKAVHAQEDLEAAREKAALVREKLVAMKLAKASQIFAEGVEETLSYMHLPREHWRCLRANNPMERLIKEVCRRTREVGSYPDGNSALMLTCARLRHTASTKWGTRRYLDIKWPHF